MVTKQEGNEAVKRLFTLDFKQKIQIALAVFLWAALLHSYGDVNLAAPIFNQGTDCKIHAAFGATPKSCERTLPEIRSAN